MKVGNVRLIPYAPPGTEELFRTFSANMGKSGAYLLRNHGPVVPGTSVFEAFYNLEELEESAHIAYCLMNKPANLLGE